HEREWTDQNKTRPQFIMKMKWSLSTMIRTSTVATKFRYGADVRIPSPPLEERARERRPFVSKFFRRNTRSWNLSEFWLLAGDVVASAAEPTEAKRTFMVPMRDGVKLATDVYLPNTNGAFPALLGRDRKSGG